MLVTDAATIWNNLRGIICVYKPADVKLNHLRKALINKICTELNEMDCRPPIDHVVIEGNPLQKLSVVIRENYADVPLVVGPRYQFNDMLCSWSNYLGLNTSGVLLFGIKTGTKVAKRIRENQHTRAYCIKGFLGQATENFYKDGKVVQRASYTHVKGPHMDRILSYMQAAHQKKMFELSGVDLQSQTAYDLAIKGPIRPANSKIPVIYGIKCVHFDPPEFTIEIQCINEYEAYLKSLVHEIGLKANSTAHCTGIKCIRHSYFTLEHALLQREWNLQNIITNMEDCSRLISDHENILYQKNIRLQQ